MKEMNCLMIGIGLIGSSLALCMKETNHNIHIIGYSQDEKELSGALSHRIIDEYSLDLKTVAEKADLIFLCTPVSVTLQLMEELAKLQLKENIIITDVGSTKARVIEEARIFDEKNICFIGGHPMAGSHKSGFLAADKDLFENAFYIIVTEEKNHHRKAKAFLKQLLSGTRAKFVELSGEEHDRITGVLSHMPHIIASQLVEQADDLMQELPESKKLAAGGFRDITRIASSDPKMWTDISLSNSTVIIEEIDKWLDNLQALKENLIGQIQEALFEFFQKAKVVRDDIPVHKEGSIPSFYDLYVNVPDYPGAIAEVTGILSEASISLINIKIMETRDDIFGILCISFKNNKDLNKAKEVITSQTAYSCLTN